MNWDKNNNRFSFRKRFESFKYAFNGIWLLLKEEHNARIHLFFALLAIAVGFWLEINRTEWLVLIITMMIVFMAEFFNSAIEAIADKVSTEKHSLIKKAKDIAAGGVLIAAITSILIGIIILGPKLLEKLF
jgi:diacylglycerol kinase